ncbi:hypothetical protein COO60DRAFT_1478283 [Scenedesmus sp. NREL 46B-D3]|nr:hypothetical protein COO60DRAFT_1478283 [Scenedesmus sp. NREL 46B-D3]
MAVLQQLRKLVLQVADKWAEDEFGRETYLERVDPLLQPLSGLTSLTSLEVGMMWSLKPLQHVPPSLFELQYFWDLHETLSHPLDLTHLTALTKLTTDHMVDIISSAKLPASLKQLRCGCVPYADVLLPLRHLQHLDILSCRTTAAELARLSSLTGLTHIGLCHDYCLSVDWESYCGYAEEEQLTPHAASAAWPALASQLRDLHIVAPRIGLDEDDLLFQLSAAALAAVASRSVMTSLKLEHMQCRCSSQQLAAALQRCTALQELELGSLELQWGPAGNLTGNAAADAPLMAEAQACGMEAVAAPIAGLPGLQKLGISRLLLSMHAAVKLVAAAAGAQLVLADCGLSALALGLTNLRSLQLQSCDVGDAALPALGKLPLQCMRWYRCCFTTAALDVFIPGWRALCTGPEL